MHPIPPTQSPLAKAQKLISSRCLSLFCEITEVETSVDMHNKEYNYQVSPRKVLNNQQQQKQKQQQIATITKSEEEYDFPS